MRFTIPSTFLKLVLLFCMYTSTFSLHSQEQEIDSLAKYSDEDLGNLYSKYLYDESGKAKIYADKLFENAKKSNDQKKLFQAYRKYAVLEKNQGNYQEALNYLEIAENIATKELKNQSLEILCVFLKGQFNYEYGKY
jgi:hypothetical protein